MKHMLMHSFLQGFQGSFRLAGAIPGAIAKAVMDFANQETDTRNRQVRQHKPGPAIAPDGERKKIC